ncbi:MAG: pyridoxal-phosphate dependent enzyme [Sporichthyaceae bacterium]|nr:pyridoxal-phosphate dependent enzyme [Sporichthyaceae bacterium]
MSGIEAIGGTPVTRLRQLAGEDSAEIWVKLEAANPTGSYKDRMALAMIEGAERDGRLAPGQTVVEYTGGSTGSSSSRPSLPCSPAAVQARITSRMAASAAGHLN